MTETASFQLADSPGPHAQPDLPDFPHAPTLPSLPETPAGRYRHYKGGDYEVIGVARHSETHEPMVIYRPLYNATGWWLRPHSMFFGDVVIDTVARPRFVRISAP